MGWSVHGVEHVEEEDAEQPHCDQDVVYCQGDVLMILADLANDGHAVQDQHADQCHPSQNGMVYAVVQKIHTQQRCIRGKVPAMPYKTRRRP
jgi:hypothetical protein